MAGDKSKAAAFKVKAAAPGCVHPTTEGKNLRTHSQKARMDAENLGS
jgi:hypothetical protein